MKKQIEIFVKNKIASNPLEQIVCGNKDYQILFHFDEEWEAHKVKTARFVWNGTHEDRVFEGDVCVCPELRNTTLCAVGVFAGDLRTTTPGLISCRKSILCEDGPPAPPSEDVYHQIMELLNSIYNGGGTTGGGGEAVSPEQIQEAVYKYMQENPVIIEETDPTIFSWAKQPKKPTYNAGEVGAYSTGEIDTKFIGVNNQIGSLSEKNQTLETTVEGLQKQLTEEAHFRGYLSTNAKIQALEATPNDFAYSAESGTKWVYDVTDGWQDTGTPVPDQLTPASDTTPLMNGVASPGSEESYARGDHVHPTDTTRVGYEEFNELKSDIEEVFSELHNYAQALITGGVN